MAPNRLLIVDDNATRRQTMVEIVEKSGASLCIEECGEFDEGMAAINKLQNELRMLWSDLELSDAHERTGLLLIQQASIVSPESNRVLISGNAVMGTAEGRARAVEMGATKVIYDSNAVLMFELRKLLARFK